MYCMVDLSEGKTYYYRIYDKNIKAGDYVIVPVGDKNVEKLAKVLEVREFFAEDVPYPLNKTKFIKKKAEKEDMYGFEKSQVKSNRNKRKFLIHLMIVCVIILGIIICVTLSDSQIKYDTYQKSIELIDNGMYEEALEELYLIDDKFYKDTNSYIKLCKAWIYYENNEFDLAYNEIKSAYFRFVTEQEQIKINDFIKKLEECIKGL